MVTIKDVKVICTAPEGINLVVVKVLTNVEGLYGLGCATFSYRHLAVKLVIEEYLRPLLIGRNVEDIEEIWQLMHQNAYWRNGPISNNAIAGIDIALWDIKGKMAGMPLYQLLGGKCRKGIQIYRHVDGHTIEEVIEKAESYKKNGVKALRFQLDGYGGSSYGQSPINSPENSLNGIYLDPDKYIDHTVELMEEVRSRFGNGIKIIHDVHERLSLTESIKLAKKLEEFDLMYLEDPIPLERIECLEEFRAKTNIPIAMGELFNNPLEWKYVINRKLIDYIRVHITQIGGITPARKLAIYAEQNGVKIAWHGPGDMSPLAHSANINLDFASMNFGIQEWSGTEPPNSIIQKLNSEKNALNKVFIGIPEVVNGYIYSNEVPGLGIDIDEELALNYPCHNSVTEWTQTRKIDGTLQVP